VLSWHGLGLRMRSRWGSSRVGRSTRTPHGNGRAACSSSFVLDWPEVAARRSGGIDCAKRSRLSGRSDRGGRRPVEGAACQRALAAGAATQVFPGPVSDPVEPGALDRWWNVWHGQELAAAGQVRGHIAAGQESVMANADEPFGQDMEQAAA